MGDAVREREKLDLFVCASLVTGPQKTKDDKINCRKNNSHFRYTNQNNYDVYKGQEDDGEAREEGE